MQGYCDQKMYMCAHIERGVNLEKLSQLSKSKLTQCEECGGKGRSSQKKAARLNSTAQQSCQPEEKWVCLACGHVACGTLLSANEEEENGKLGEKKDENKAPAQGHAWGHFVVSKHPLAMQTGDSNVYWCFICKMRVDYSMPLVDNPNDLPSSNWRNPLQDAADVVRGKFSKRKGLFKDPAKVCYTIEPVRCMIDTVKSVIDSATHLRANDVGKSSSSLVNTQNLGYGKKHLVKGLINLGNTCFFNSVLQNLLALDVLRNHFSREPLNNEGPLTSSLRSLFQEMNSEQVSVTNSNASSYDFGMRRGSRALSTGGTDGKVCNPSSLFDAVCAKAPRFRGFQQQDSHELLRYLLEGLNFEERGAATYLPTGDYRKAISTSLSKVLGQNGSSGDSESVEEDKEHGKTSKPSTVVPTLVERVFGGQLSSTVHCCECGHVSVVYETMLDISLQIPTRQSSRKREECEEQETSNLLEVRSQETLKQDSGQTERTEMLETQETLIASTLGVARSKHCLLGSSRSAQADCLDSDLANEADSPQASLFDELPSRDPNFLHSGGSSADCSLQNACNSSDNPVKTLSRNAGACIPRDHLKAGSDPSIHEQRRNLDGRNIDTCLLVDMSGDGEERLGRPISSREEESAYAATECSVDKLSCKEGKDLSSSADFTKEHQELCLQRSESADIVCGKIQDMKEMEAFKGHCMNGEVLEKTNVINSCSREAQCEASGKVKVALGPEQLIESEDTASHLSIELCLADFIKSELLCGDNAWECEKCSKLVEGTSHSQSVNDKLKTGEGHTFKDRIKHLSDDLADSRMGTMVDADSLSRASCVNFEADSYQSAVGNNKFKQIQSASANGATSEDNFPTIEREENHIDITKVLVVDTRQDGQTLDTRGLNDHDRSSDLQTLSMEKSVILYPSLNKLEQPEGNGLGHTCSKMLPNLRMEKLSFLSNFFFRTENQKGKTDHQQKLVKRQAIKKFLICKVPLVLTVHLKRFAQDVCGRLNKLSGHVAFSEYLNLQPFLDPRSPDYNECIYRLMGIVEHGGTMRGGHYVAYVRGPSDETSNLKDTSWYHISDSTVSRSTLQDVLGREAYLLFYERYNARKEG